jgi:hypothetical protein
VKGINDFIGKTYKSVNGVDRRSQFFIENPDTHRKRGGVSLGDELATFGTGGVIKRKMIHDVKV